MTQAGDRVALVLGGGGARAAYQAGFVRYIGRNYTKLPKTFADCGLS